jgi:5-(carboxyamino)imidazole ribonucleotide mutase
MSQSRVAILMGSKSDLPLMEPAAQVLKELGVASELRVISAHRTPERARELAHSARGRGIQVIICGAGGAAHLAGAIAAHTTLPVIGVPLARTPLGGQDALLATVQMPREVPVATVAIDGAVNAGLLAAQIMAIADPDLAERLDKRRDALNLKVQADDESLRAP